MYNEFTYAFIQHMNIMQRNNKAMYKIKKLINKNKLTDKAFKITKKLQQTQFASLI